MKKICVTNRRLVRGDFLLWLEMLLQSEKKPDAVVLREKDLSEEEYEELAAGAQKICRRRKISFVINSFDRVAEKLGVCTVHLPYGRFLEEMTGSGSDVLCGGLDAVRTDASGERVVQGKRSLRQRFARIGTSIHKPDEAELAERLGADYVFAGHIFATDCKKDLAPRGLDFLRACCSRVKIPVYAIGGIPLEGENADSRQQQCAGQGAAGVCIMSDYARW